MINWLQVRLLAEHFWVSTWMDDCVWVGKPSWYVISHLGLPSIIIIIIINVIYMAQIRRMQQMRWCR